MKHFEKNFQILVLKRKNSREFISIPKLFEINIFLFIFLGIPPRISTRYRSRYMKYWNEILPNMLKNHTNPLVSYDIPPAKYPKTTQRPYRFAGT